MTGMITTGIWKVAEERQAAFIDAWSSFASWASSQEGAATLRLGQDATDPTRFVSFGPWQSADQVHAWKGGPEFRERMAHVQRYVDEFHPSELDLVAWATDGAPTTDAT
jgi:heme-degrading monooxygenase HmoA